MTEQACKHRPYWWTIQELIVNAKGEPVMQTLLVGGCCNCGEPMPTKVLKEESV